MFAQLARVDATADAICTAAERGDTERMAALCGHVHVMRLLLDLPPERGVDPAADSTARLRCAAWLGSAEVVRLLRECPPERGVDPAACNNEAVRTTASEAVARLLTELPPHRGVDVTAGGFSAYTKHVRELGGPCACLSSSQCRRPALPGAGDAWR